MLDDGISVDASDFPSPSGYHRKTVREHKAVQQLKSFTGDRAKFREWNEKLLIALAQVDVKNRKVLKR